jgi:hypothetical protein
MMVAALPAALFRAEQSDLEVVGCGNPRHCGGSIDHDLSDVELLDPGCIGQADR